MEIQGKKISATPKSPYLLSFSVVVLLVVWKEEKMFKDVMSVEVSFSYA